MEFKRFFLLLVAVSLVLVLVLAGCSKNDNEAEPSKGTTEEPAKEPAKEPEKVTTDPVEISYWTGNPELEPWLLKMADGIRKKNLM